MLRSLWTWLLRLHNRGIHDNDTLWNQISKYYTNYRFLTEYGEICLPEVFERYGEPSFVIGKKNVRIL